MPVRCKLRCFHIQQNGQVDDPCWSVKFTAVWEGSSEMQEASENAVFGKWTPHAEFIATIRNPEAIKQFEVNKEYYFDITECLGWSPAQLEAARGMLAKAREEYEKHGASFEWGLRYWEYSVKIGRVATSEEVDNYIASLTQS